ncbi:MAG: hypothetical protein V4671_31370 [Armatimonadota bacterium]
MMPHRTKGNLVGTLALITTIIGSAVTGSVFWYQYRIAAEPKPESLVMLQQKYIAEYAGVKLSPDFHYRFLVAGISPQDVDHMELQLSMMGAKIEVRDPERIGAFLLGLAYAVEFPQPPEGFDGQPGIPPDHLTIYLRDNLAKKRIGKTIEVSFFGLYTATSFSPEFHAAVAYTQEPWEREQKRKRYLFSLFGL